MVAHHILEFLSETDADISSASTPKEGPDSSDVRLSRHVLDYSAPSTMLKCPDFRGDRRCCRNFMNRHYIALLVTLTTLVGCTVTGESSPTLVSQTSTPVAMDLPREIIGLSISLYLLVDDKDRVKCTQTRKGDERNAGGVTPE